MAEKLEQSKEFSEEFEFLRNNFKAPFEAMREVNESWEDYPILNAFLFSHENINQLTFAKIWAGEIELVEKKPKYIIYQIDDDEIVWILANNNHGTLRNEIDTSTNILKNHRSYNDSSAYFDQDFAFAMRDTGKFKIEKVVE